VLEALAQLAADFAIGTTINWSPQVKELNLFCLPFLLSSYKAVDAVQAAELGDRLFKLIEQKGVVPIAWGENGFREATNSKRPIRRPEDLQGLNIRVPPVQIVAGVGVPKLAGDEVAFFASTFCSGHDPTHLGKEPLHLRSAARCGARTRSGRACQSPAVAGRARCRMHGGAKDSGGPRGRRNGNYKHGRYTAEAKQMRLQLRQWITNQLRHTRALIKRRQDLTAASIKTS
jgi:hypothetical protein